MTRKMNSWCKWWKWGGIGRVPPFIIFALLLGTLLMPIIMATPARAAGEIAISGSFYNQAFQIPQGSSASGPSIYVVVFNQSSEEFTVTMSTVAPPGVTVNLSRTTFVLQPGSQQQVQVGVTVAADAVPDTYVDGLEVSAQASTEGTGGIVILGAAAQRATLVVTGESALVMVDSVGPSGQPVSTVVRLFKVINGEPFEFAYNNTGHLEATVSPGSYLASAYNNGDKLAEEAFDVAADEVKQVTLTVNTIYFSLFEISPAYNNETGELGFVQVSYTVKNVYQQMATAEVRLMVTLDGAPLEEMSILNLSPLNLGDFGAPYTYMPANGWQNGTYGFSLRLYVDDQLYAGTQEKTLELGGGSSSTNWLIFVLAGLGGGLVIGGIIVFFKRRKKPDKPEKARKLEKHSGKGRSPEVGEAAGTTFGLKRLFNRGSKITKKSTVPRKGTAVAKLPEVGKSAGTAFGLKRLFGRRGKTVKKQAIVGRGTAAIGVGVPASTAAKEAAIAKASAMKDDQAKAETKESTRESSVIDTGKVADNKATGGESTASRKETVVAQDSTAAKPSAAGTAAAPTAKAAPAAGFQVKSAADVKQAAAARWAEAAKPAEATRSATPPEQAAHVGESIAVPAQPAKRPAAATPSISPAYAQHVRETVPAGGSTTAASPKKKREPLMVPSPFSPPKQVSPGKEVKLDKKSTTSRHDEAAEAPVVPSAGVPAEQALPVEVISVHAEPFEAAQESVAPPQEESPVTQEKGGIEETAVTRETAVEATVTAPTPSCDAEPAVTKEKAGVEPAEDRNGTMGAEARANDDAGDAEDQAHQDGDEAKKKFVSPIRFFNR